VDVVDIAAYFGAFKAEKYSSMTAEDMIGLNFEMRQGERPHGLLVVPETLPLADMVSFLAFGIRHAYVKSENSDDELRVLSQMDLLKYLARDPAAQKISSQAIATSGLIDRRETPLCIVDSACTVKDAFAKIVKEFADAGAIVDSFGYLIGTLSTSDVRELVKGQGIESNLKLTVTEFLAAVHRGEGIAEPVTVVPEDSVATAMNKMLEKDVRRSWVVNEAYEPIGCIAAEDVIAKFGRNYFE
jgi:CBS domain-containing protein